MPITFACSSCSQPLKVKDELAGRAVKCPKCGQAARVPAPAPQIQAGSDVRIVEEEPAAKPPPRPLPHRPRRPLGSKVRAGSAGAEGRTVLQALVGGAVAALLGAFVWYLLAKGIHAKVGWVAWGIGWATGFAVAVASGNRGAAIFSAIGAGTALLGWFLGEYMIYSWMFQDLLRAELAKMAGAAANDPEMQEKLRRALQDISFGDYLKNTFGAMDVLFIVLAVATGWGVPRKMASR